MTGPGGVPGGPGYGVGRAITPSNTDLDYVVQQATLAQGKATTAGALAPGATINGVLFTGATNITLAATTVHTLTLGTGLSGGAFNGSAAVTATVTGAPWSGVTGTPTTISGYGITDAYTKTASDARFAAIAGPFPWADVTGTPTTLAGYGITNPLNIAQGGTALSAYTVGDVLYASGTTALSTLGIGAANTVLTSSGSAPQWSTTIAYAALPSGTGTWAANGIVTVQGATNTATSTALSIQQTDTGSTSAISLNAELFDSAGSAASAGALTFAKTLAWTNGTPATFTSSLTVTLNNNGSAFNALVIDTKASTVATTLPLEITTASTSIFTGGANSATGVAIGRGGGSTPTANRTVVLQIDGASSATFFGSQLIQFQQAGTTGWSVGQNFNLTTLHSAVTDFVFLQAAGTPMAVLTAAGLWKTAGGMTAAGLITASLGLTVTSGQTLTLTGTTVAGAPTWSSGQTFPTVTATGAFGCNTKVAQTAFASGGAAPAGGTGTAAGAYDTSAHRDALITLVNNIRSALVANGIMS